MYGFSGVEQPHANCSPKPTACCNLAFHSLQKCCYLFILFFFFSRVLKLDTSLHLQATCLKGAAAVGLAETPPVYCSADPYLHRYDRADSYKTRHFGFRIDPHNKVLIRPLSLCSSNLKHFQRIAAFIVL